LALTLVNGVLKKVKHSDIAQALKAIALERLGRTREADVVVSELTEVRVATC